MHAVVHTNRVHQAGALAQAAQRARLGVHDWYRHRRACVRAAFRVPPTFRRCGRVALPTALSVPAAATLAFSPTTTTEASASPRTNTSSAVTLPGTFSMHQLSPFCWPAVSCSSRPLIASSALSSCRTRALRVSNSSSGVGAANPPLAQPGRSVARQRCRHPRRRPKPQSHAAPAPRPSHPVPAPRHSPPPSVDPPTGGPVPSPPAIESHSSVVGSRRIARRAFNRRCLRNDSPRPALFASAGVCTAFVRSCGQRRGRRGDRPAVGSVGTETDPGAAPPC